MKTNILLLTSIIFFSFKVSLSQTDSFSCGTDSLWAKTLEANPKLSYVKYSIKENAKIFRQNNPNLVFPVKPMPDQIPCELCMLSMAQPKP
jgi:hypothetical protein